MEKKSSIGEYVIYVLLCADNTLYTGITNDLEHRLKIHEMGKGAKYVRARLPFRLIYTESSVDRSSASKRECEIKSWSRKLKIKNLILKMEN